MMMSKRRVKRTVRRSCTPTTISKQQEILLSIKQGYSHTFQLLECLKITKQALNYHTQKLVKAGLISAYARGTYDLTDAGKKMHAVYEKNKNKQLIQLENMRYSALIYDGFDILMEHVRDPKKTILNNGVTQYTGKIKNLSVKVITSDKSKSIEVTCEKLVGENRYEIMYDARKQVEDILNAFNKIDNMKIGMIKQSMSPEWAEPHPYAEIILKTTDSSQIRCGGGVINRSAGRNADWEVDDITKSMKIMNMPNDVEDIRQQLSQQHQLLQRLIQQNGMNTPYSLFI